MIDAVFSLNKLPRSPSFHRFAAPRRAQTPMSSLPELRKLIHAKYGIDLATLDPDKPMREQGLDSLALAEFLFDVEDHFQIVFDQEQPPEIDTLAGLADLIDRLQAAKTT
jgi:acyl carrier protein